MRVGGNIATVCFTNLAYKLKPRLQEIQIPYPALF